MDDLTNTSNRGTFTKVLEGCNAPCLEAARWVDHALTCDFCKNALAVVGEWKANSDQLGRAQDIQKTLGIMMLATAYAEHEPEGSAIKPEG